MFLPTLPLGFEIQHSLEASIHGHLGSWKPAQDMNCLRDGKGKKLQETALRSKLQEKNCLKIWRF